MRLLTCKQSSADTFCLATGSAELGHLTVYNPSSTTVNVELRAYDQSKDLHIGLSRHSLTPNSTTAISPKVILNDGDEAYISGNSSNHNLQYTYGVSGNTSRTFIALDYYDADSAYLTSPSYAPPNVEIKSFNATTSPSELILQAHENSPAATNNIFAQNIGGGQSRSITYPPFDTYDYSLADNQVAHPFDLCIYYDYSSLPQYGSYTKSAGTKQIGNFSDIWVQKQFQVYNITRGTDNPVNVHIKFSNSVGGQAEAFPAGSNVIQVVGTDTDSNGKVTDAHIVWYQPANMDWGAPPNNGGGWNFWDVGSYKNQDGSIKTPPVNSIGYSGTGPGYTRDNSATGYIEIQFFMEGYFAIRPVPGGTPYQRLMTTANTTYTAVNNGSGRKCYPSSAGAGKQCGLTPTQQTWYYTFGRYDPSRGGYFLDLAGDGAPVSQAGWF